MRVAHAYHVSDEEEDTCSFAASLYTKYTKYTRTLTFESACQAHSYITLANAQFLRGHQGALTVSISFPQAQAILLYTATLCTKLNHDTKASHSPKRRQSSRRRRGTTCPSRVLRRMATRCFLKRWPLRKMISWIMPCTCPSTLRSSPLARNSEIVIYLDILFTLIPLDSALIPCGKKF